MGETPSEVSRVRTRDAGHLEIASARDPRSEDHRVASLSCCLVSFVPTDSGPHVHLQVASVRKRHKLLTSAKNREALLSLRAQQATGSCTKSHRKNLTSWNCSAFLLTSAHPRNRFQKQVQEAKHTCPRLHLAYVSLNPTHSAGITRNLLCHALFHRPVLDLQVREEGERGERGRGWSFLKLSACPW